MRTALGTPDHESERTPLGRYVYDCTTRAEPASTTVLFTVPGEFIFPVAPTPGCAPAPTTVTWSVP